MAAAKKTEAELVQEFLEKLHAAEVAAENVSLLTRRDAREAREAIERLAWYHLPKIALVD